MRVRNWVLGLALLAFVCMAGSAQAVVSVDFVYNGYDVSVGVTSPCSGDTVLTPGETMTNADGIIFTGQSGPWNAVAVGGNNSGNNSAGTLGLLDGTGGASGMNFLMGVAADAGSGGWRNNWSAAISSGSTGETLRNPPPYDYTTASECPYLYDGVLTGPSYSWAFTGLTPNAAYKIAFFGSGSEAATSHTANGVAAVLDSEGDWNWDSVTADGTGQILGVFTGTACPGLFGVQIAAAGGGPVWPDYLAGDFNKDGEVGPEDFGILKDNFGLDSLPFGNHESWTLGDANDDGEIGPEDFGMLKDNFGLDGGPTGTYPLTNVPEPMSLLTLLGVGVPMLLKRRAKA
ncbi:MAG: hypothetical protein NTV86_18405 [Planctomycetota bacterium]|nr:hypothetical protein [Planctomycetota bacterium]